MLRWMQLRLASLRIRTEVRGKSNFGLAKYIKQTSAIVLIWYNGMMKITMYQVTWCWALSRCLVESKQEQFLFSSLVPQNNLAQIRPNRTLVIHIHHRCLQWNKFHMSEGSQVQSQMLKACLVNLYLHDALKLPALLLADLPLRRARNSKIASRTPRYKVSRLMGWNLHAREVCIR